MTEHNGNGAPETLANLGETISNLNDAYSHGAPNAQQSSTRFEDSEFSWPPDFKLSVLMPVFNEQNTIEAILDRVFASPIPKEIILVDDGSTDDTRAILRRRLNRNAAENSAENEQLRVFFHHQNGGKGAALRTAISKASGTVCLVQDADLEYDPDEYATLLQPIWDGRADVVYGSRFLGGVGAHRVHLFWHAVGNRALTNFSNACTNLNLTDMETCYKVVKTDLLQSLNLRSNGFEIEPELTAKLAKKHAHIYEVPISYSGRDYSEGKKIGWRDGVRALWAISRYRLGD